MKQLATATHHNRSFFPSINRRTRPVRTVPGRSTSPPSSAGSFPSKHGVLILPGLFSGEEAYQSLANDLTKQGFCTKIVPIKWKQWIPPFLGQDFEFYLKATSKALESLYQQCGLDWNNDKIAIVAHSAGGFLARILMGDHKYQGQLYGLASKVHTLITLGSPHKSIEKYPVRRIPEKLHIEGEEDFPTDKRCTSTLQFANKFYPNAESFPDVRIVCIAGDVSSGNLCEAYRELEFLKSDSGGMDNQVERRRHVLERMFFAATAYFSYKAGCDEPNVRGDIITPIKIAHLDGAENLSLHGVWHGPPLCTTRWYGSEYNQWLRYLYQPNSTKKL